MRSQTELKGRRDYISNDERVRDLSYEKDKKIYRDLSIKQDEILKEIKDLEEQIEAKYKNDYSLERCSNCDKFKSKAQKKKRVIDASPLKFKNGRANSAHRSKLRTINSIYHGSDDGASYSKSRASKSRGVYQDNTSINKYDG